MTCSQHFLNTGKCMLVKTFSISSGMQKLLFFLVRPKSNNSLESGQHFTLTPLILNLNNTVHKLIVLSLSIVSTICPRCNG